MKTKQELNYRYPVQCCGYCEHSYQNTYGDYCCDLLNSIDLVDIGGCCDCYVKATVNMTVKQSVTTAHLDKSCTLCKYSWLDDSKQPRCYWHGTMITDVYSYCKSFIRSEV